MKPTLLFATLSMVFASPTLSAKSELELLRARCAEQERQIQQLEQDNMRLRSATNTPRSASEPSEANANANADSPTANSAAATYTVKPGDSFEKIARKTGTSVANLTKWNRLKSSAMIHPGQTLKIAAPGATTTSTTSTAATPAKSATSGKTYQIRSGDTYSSIARKQKVSVASLIAANPSVKATALRVGQTIRLDAGSAPPATPPPTTASAPAPAPAPKPVAASAPPVSAPNAPAPIASAPQSPASTWVPTLALTDEGKPAPAQETLPATQETPSTIPDKKFKPITIDGEMTYGDFASQHGTDIERLNALNGLDLNTTTVLAKGSELYVPAQP